MPRNTDRILEEQDDSPAVLDQRARAVRNLASAATDAADFLTLLDALGLRAEEGRRVGPTAARG